MKAPLAALIFTETAALSGTRLSMIALPWLVLTELGDPMLAGAVAFAEMAPYVIAKALVGPLIDRLGARRIAIVADAGSALAVATIPLLHAFGLLVPGLLLPLVALIGAMRGPGDGARYALVRQVAEVSGVPISRVTGLLGVVERLAASVGAGVAAAIVALIGPAATLGPTAALLVLAALITWVGLRGLPAQALDTQEEALPYLARLQAGWRFLRRDTVLIGITSMIAVTNLLDQAAMVVLLPVWAVQSGAGIAAMGLLMMVFSLAAMTGSAISAALAERLPRLPVYAGAYLIVGLPRYAIFVWDLPLPVMGAVIAVAGLASGFLNPIIGAVIFERVPPALTGRVTALFTASAWALMPFGGLLAGALIAPLGLSATFLLVGCAYFVATMAPLLLPGFRQIGVRTDATAEAA